MPEWFARTQVIGAILDHLTRGQAPVYLRASSKTPADYWGKDSPGFDSGEHVFRIYGNDLVHGVLDKAQFGSFGLVHAVQETLGNKAAGWILSAFSRIFTTWLQMHGFTCGMEDIVLNPLANAVRREKLAVSEETARAVAATFAKVERTAGAFDPKDDFRNELGTKLRNKPTSTCPAGVRFWVS
jgi:DNA-directed RNA polymerase I subunit RPA1